MGRKKVIDRDRILDAVEGVVRRDGIERLTLEAVAKEAGISKGGLVYSFPSKDEMMAAMMQRDFSRFHAEVVAAAKANGGRYPEIKMLFALSLKRSRADRARGVRMMAALVESPACLAVIRLFYRRIMKTFDTRTEAGRQARLAFMAGMGALYLNGFGHVEMKDPYLKDVLKDALALLGR